MQAREICIALHDDCAARATVGQAFANRAVDQQAIMVIAFQDDDTSTGDAFCHAILCTTFHNDADRIGVVSAQSIAWDGTAEET